MNLIYGQPLHPVDSPVRVHTPHRTHEQLQPAPPPRQQGPAPADRVSQPQTAASRTMNGSAPGPAPLKRAASPRSTAEPPKKKKKEVVPHCVVCRQPPPHPWNVCPAIAQGSGRYAERGTCGIDFDRSFVWKDRERAMAAAGGSDRPTVNNILSDSSPGASAPARGSSQWQSRSAAIEIRQWRRHNIGQLAAIECHIVEHICDLLGS